MKQSRKHNHGFTLVELLIAMVLGVSIMAGVMEVMVLSKNNFVTERELATLQENARFALKFIGDEIRMAGFNGCSNGSPSIANSINNSASSWYLNGTGIEGYEQGDTFPSEFSADVAANTDAVVIRRAVPIGLKLSGTHNPNSARIGLNNQHSLKMGQVMVVSTPDCQQVAIFQVSGPTNTNNNATHINHNTGSMVPGNCTKNLGGNFSCASAGSSLKQTYPQGSSVMSMQSQAFYIGISSVGNGIPALFRESMALNEGTQTVFTSAQELVQGVENMQILYGLDNALDDNIADIYLAASSVADWNNVVSVRLSLRMRSIYPVLNEDRSSGAYMDIDATIVSDRFMRQEVTTTIQLRN